MAVNELLLNSNTVGKKDIKQIITNVCLVAIRILILLACVTMFFPSFNPGRISLKINKSISLFTTAVSYNNITTALGLALRRGWVHNYSFIILMISSLIIVFGIIACGIGGCMSLGNTLMKKKGLWFPVFGPVVMLVGLGGIYIAYSQVKQTAMPDRIQPNFSWGFYFYLILAVLILILSVIIKILIKNNQNEEKMKIKEKYSLFLYMLPIIFLAFIFSYMPLWGWRYAFFEYSAGQDLTWNKFVGFYYFKLLVQNQSQRLELLKVLRNTFVMSGLGILTSWLPIAFAIFLTEIKSTRFKKFVQTFTTIPNFISWVLVYAVALAIFSSDGFLNGFINLLGKKSSTNYLQSSKGTWLKMLLWGTWKGLGWSAIIYISSIAGIDQQLYESAMIDGAGRFQKMWYITVPSLMPTYSVMLLLSIAGILNNGMEQYLVFKNPNNSEEIKVLDLYVYLLGIDNGQIPMSTVIGMAKSLVSVFLLFVANGVSKLIRGESIV